MAPPESKKKTSGLGVRTLSSLVLGPLVLGAVYVGSPVYEALVVVLAAVMAWEWTRMCAGGRFGPAGAVLATGAILAAGAAALGHPLIGLVAAAAGSVLALPFATREARRNGQAAAGWLALGSLYVGVPCVALVWLRAAPASDGGMVDGRAILFWLLAVVWATDIGAYAFGRTIGGPKLAPRVSPNKTWAGLIGGAVCAGLSSLALALGLSVGTAVAAGLAGAGLAVVAQIGDLFESGVKRRFGVKDSSTIIPGHGGVLDRVDGLLAAAAVTAVVMASGTGGGSA